MKLFLLFLLASFSAFAAKEKVYGELIVNDRTVNSGNTKGSVSCNPMTDAQMQLRAFAPPNSAECVYNTTKDATFVWSSARSQWRQSGGGGAGGSRLELQTDPSFESDTYDGVCSGCTATVISSALSSVYSPYDEKALSISFSGAGTYTVDKLTGPMFSNVMIASGLWGRTTISGCYFVARRDGANFGAIKTFVNDGSNQYAAKDTLAGATSTGYQIYCPSAGTIIINETKLQAEDKYAMFDLPNKSGWSVCEPIQFTTTAGSTINAGTTTINCVQWKQDGDDYLIRYQFVQSSVGSTGSGDMLIKYPSGIISASSVPLNSTDTIYNRSAYNIAMTGSLSISGATGSLAGIYAIPYANDRFRVDTYFGGGSSAYGTWGSTFAYLTNANTRFSALIRVKGEGLVASTQAILGRCSNKANCMSSYTGVFTNAGVLTTDNGVAFATCTASGTSVNTCTYTAAAGITVRPSVEMTGNCSSSASGGNAVWGVTSTGFSMRTINITGPVEVACEKAVTVTKLGVDAENARLQYVLAAVRESNLIYDIEKFPTSETQICTACYKTKPLYKRCFTGSTANGTSMVTGVTEMVKQYGSFQFSGTQSSQFPYGYSSNYERFDLNQSTGVVTLQSDATRVINACVEYTKN